MLNLRNSLQKHQYDIVIITEDNSQIKSFRSSFGRVLGNWYLNWYARKVEQVCKEAARKQKKVLLVANSELLALMILPNKCESLPLDQLMEVTDFETGGQIAAQFSDEWKDASWFREFSPDVQNQIRILSKIAFVQISFLYFFYSVIYFQMWKNFLTLFDFKKVWLISRISDMEQIALQVFKNSNQIVKIKSHVSILSCLRQSMFKMLYKRDRMDRVKRLNPNVSPNKKSDYQAAQAILVCCHPLQLKMAIPLSELLSKQDITNHMIVTVISSEDKAELNRRKISWSQASDYLNDLEFARLNKEFSTLNSNLWAAISRQMSRTFQIDEIDFFDLNKDKIEVFVKQSFTEAGLYHAIAEKIIKAHHPKIVTVFSDARFLEAGIAQAAKASEIVTFLLSPNPVMSADAINRYDTCQYVGVLGEHIYNRLVERKSVSLAQLEKVGDLRFDALKDIRFDISQTRSKLGISPEKELVTITSFYTTSWHPIEEKKIFLKSLCAAIKKIPNLELVIKAHPNEDESLLRLLLKTEGFDNLIIVKQFPIYELLMNSKFVITLASSMTPIEAMLLDVPVVCFSLSWKVTDKLFQYVKKEGAIGIDETSDMENIFLKLKNDDDYRSARINLGRKFVSGYIQHPVGQAGARILKLYEQWLSEPMVKN